MIKSKNKVGIILFPAFDWEISLSHPERKERLLYTSDQIFEEGISDINGISFHNPKMASLKDVKRVHFVVPNVSSILTESHLISSGAAIKALDLVMQKKIDKAFSLTRPPGHHAMRVVYGDRGFCKVNVEAVMIENIRQKYGNLKVAIIDTDCHHGDGTEDIYWNDPNTLFISIHQDGRTLYPGTGFIDELGGPSAYGYNINIPLPPNTGDEGFLSVIDNLVLPILKDFKPDLIINSAGQDNHYSDPLTNMNLSAKGYAKLNDKLNPDVCVLEGGYSIEGALPYINTGIILALAGIDYNNVIEPDFNIKKVTQSKEVTNYINDLVERIYNTWKNKKKLSKEKFKNQTYIKETKRIYYDTSNILEHQTRTYKKCLKCSGVLKIKSNNDKDKKILAVSIPLDACLECQKEGKELFDNANKNKYTNIYIQDRVNDIFLSKSK